MATAQEKATPCCGDNNNPNSSTAPLRPNRSPSSSDPTADPIRNRAPVAALMPAVDSFADPPPKTTSTKGFLLFMILPVLF